MAIRIARLGANRRPAEGTRIGAVHRPPRGVPKAEFARQNWPSWSAVGRSYRAEMAQPDTHHALAMLASLSATSPLSAGCYCQDEACCHRFMLRALLPEQGAHLADGVSALTARKPGQGGAGMAGDISRCPGSIGCQR